MHLRADNQYRTETISLSGAACSVTLNTYRRSSYPMNVGFFMLPCPSRCKTPLASVDVAQFAYAAGSNLSAFLEWNILACCFMLLSVSS